MEDEEKIKDTREFAAADRKKQVSITGAEEIAQEKLIQEVKEAEAEKGAATHEADAIVIKAQATRDAAEKETEAKKMLAEATQAETAATGLGEAQVIRSKAEAEAKGREAIAVAIEKEGTAEAQVLELKFTADAKGINQKADAMKKFHDAGKEHEEFKLKLNKDKEVELEAIDVQRQIAEAQARMIAEALKSANIDIVGGDNEFFQSIVKSVTAGKQVDRLVGESSVLTDVKETFFTGNPNEFRERLQYYIDMFGISSADIKNLSIAALITQLMGMTSDSGIRGHLDALMGVARTLGLSDSKAAKLNLTGKSARKS